MSHFATKEIDGEKQECKDTTWQILVKNCIGSVFYREKVAPLHP